MAQINTSNFAQVTGRLVAAPKVFEPNKDNSRGVALTVWYRSGFGKDSVIRNVDLKGFIPANEDGSVREGSVYSFMEKGSLVQIAYEPQVENYTGANGKVYKNVNQIVRGGVTLMDPKADKAEAAAPAQAAQGQAPATVGAV